MSLTGSELSGPVFYFSVTSEQQIHRSLLIYRKYPQISSSNFVDFVFLNFLISKYNCVILIYIM